MAMIVFTDDCHRCHFKLQALQTLWFTDCFNCRIKTQVFYIYVKTIFSTTLILTEIQELGTKSSNIQLSMIWKFPQTWPLVSDQCYERSIYRPSKASIDLCDGKACQMVHLKWMSTNWTCTERRDGVDHHRVMISPIASALPIYRVDVAHTDTFRYRHCIIEWPRGSGVQI